MTVRTQRTYSVTTRHFVLVGAAVLVVVSGTLPCRAAADAPTYDRAAIEARAPSQLRQKPRPGNAYLESGRSLYGRYC